MNNPSEIPATTGSGDGALPPIDLAPLLTYAGNDVEMLRDLIDLFIRDTQTNLDRLTRAVEARDAKAIHEAAHSSAGACETCGVKGLAAPLRTLAHAARRGELGSAEELLRQSREAFAVVKPILLQAK